MHSPKIRTRFAPSPTGLLHLGGVRTALFSYLFAKHYKGDFIVRFEDTDLERSDHSLIEKQLRDLRWLGLNPDFTIGSESKDGPFLQSERLSLYHQHGQQLLKTKQAYYCFCTKEELASERKKQIATGKKAPKYNRKCLDLSAQAIDKLLKVDTPHCLRLKILPGQPIVFTDLVYGKTTFSSDHLEDFVLIKGDGYPTYNFAVVVDDHLMAITHVLRGSDHLTNTAKQIVLYQTYQWTTPTFGHLTLLKFKDQKKMSKRLATPTQYLDYFQEQGYLPAAVFNYLALLGWTPDKFQEVFLHPTDLINKFDGKNLNKAQSTFSLVKLDWISHKHIVAMSETSFLAFGRRFCLQLQVKKQLTDSQLEALMLFFQKEINYFKQLPDLIEKTFFPIITFQKEHLLILQKHLLLLADFLQMIETVPWTTKDLKDHLLLLSQKHQLTGKKFFLPLRLAVAGLPHGPQMEQFLFFLGRKQVQNHLRQQISWTQQLNH